LLYVKCDSLLLETTMGHLVC